VKGKDLVVDFAFDFVFDFAFDFARHSERLFTGAKNPDTVSVTKASSSFSQE
jgi:hypothetical protein